MLSNYKNITWYNYFFWYPNSHEIIPVRYNYRYINTTTGAVLWNPSQHFHWDHTSHGLLQTKDCMWLQYSLFLGNRTPVTAYLVSRTGCHFERIFPRLTGNLLLLSPKLEIKLWWWSDVSSKLSTSLFILSLRLFLIKFLYVPSHLGIFVVA